MQSENNDFDLSIFTIPLDPARAFMRGVMESFLHIEVNGIENIPESGGGLLVCNHTDYLDVLVQGSYCPRKLHFLGKSELFEPEKEILETLQNASLWNNLLLAPVRFATETILKSYGMIQRAQLKEWGGTPIVRGGMKAGSAKEAASYYKAVEDQLVEMLKSGKLVSIFPEGTRSETGVMGPFKVMTARLAIRAGVPIIPSGIHGAFGFTTPENFLTGEALKRLILYNIGQPILPKDFPEGDEKKASKELTAELERIVYALTLHPERRHTGRGPVKRTKARQL